MTTVNLFNLPLKNDECYLDELASKGDINLLEERLGHRMTSLEEHLEHRIMSKVYSALLMQTFALAALFGGFKLLGH